MRILITGIHGFVGSNLTKKLKKKHVIYGLDIVSPLKEGVVSNFGWNELEQMPSVDVIIHLAGKAHDTRNTVLEQEYFDINLGLTQKIFEYFLQSSASKFIFFSSVKAVADQVDGDILTEDVVPYPKGPYGESKLAAENYILSQLPSILPSTRFAARGTSLLREQTQGADLKPRTWNLEPGTWNKKVFILRPCMIYGPGNKGNLNLLYKMVSKGIPWPLGAYENQRSFCSIDNLNMIIGELIHRNNIPSGVYNICDDEALSTNDIIRLIAESKDSTSRIWKTPKSIIHFVARIGDIFRLPLNTERLQKLTENYVVSNEKIKKALGIKSMPVKASEGLMKTLKRFR